MEQTLSSMQTLLIWSLIEVDVDEPDKVKLYQINIFFVTLWGLQYAAAYFM